LCQPDYSSTSAAPPMQTTTMTTSQPLTKERSYPNTEPKLADNIILPEQTLEQLDHGEGSIWGIVTGEIEDAAEGLTPKIGKSTDEGKKALTWRRDNSFDILTMKRN